MDLQFLMQTGASCCSSPTAQQPASARVARPVLNASLNTGRLYESLLSAFRSSLLTDSVISFLLLWTLPFYTYVHVDVSDADVVTALICT
jgi:hypothetical protein